MNEDDRIVRLLEEIRDLQRQHVENYKDALRNQEESIRIQKTHSRRMVPIVILLVLFLVWISYGPAIWHWLFSR